MDGFNFRRLNLSYWTQPTSKVFAYLCLQSVQLCTWKIPQYRDGKCKFTHIICSHKPLCEDEKCNLQSAGWLSILLRPCVWISDHMNWIAWNEYYFICSIKTYKYIVRKKILVTRNIRFSRTSVNISISSVQHSCYLGLLLSVCVFVLAVPPLSATIGTNTAGPGSLSEQQISCGQTLLL